MQAVALVRETRADAGATQSRSAADWFEEETFTHVAAAGDVARAGAGGLLLAIGLTELVLGLQAAALWQLGVALVLAVMGIVALARPLQALARRT